MGITGKCGCRNAKIRQFCVKNGQFGVRGNNMGNGRQRTCKKIGSCGLRTTKMGKNGFR